jgi:hypothetical protein
MGALMARDDEQRDAMLALIVAEVEFLRSMLWVPFAPVAPGGPVSWQSPSGEGVRPQNEAVLEAKAEWVRRYER